MNTMREVIAAMELLPKKRSLLPFHMVYFMVTKKVQEQARTFEDQQALEKLDVHFASLYFAPLNEYLSKNEYQTPWKIYYRYSERTDAIPFVLMLLGINAHINTDLYASLYATNYRNKNDFMKINMILLEVLPQITTYLALHHFDLISIGERLFLRKLFTNLCNEIIANWRDVTWENREKTTESNKKELWEKIANQTEHIAEEVIDIFHHIGPFTILQSIDRMKKLRIHL